MIEGGKFFKQNGNYHLAENSREYSTLEEFLALIEPYAAVPLTGERSVQAIREQWQGTPLEQVLQELEGEELNAGMLLRTIVASFSNENNVDVMSGLVTREIDGEWRTDNMYHMNWQGKAIMYRLAAERVVGALPEKNRDKIDVTFTPQMTRSNAFILYEDRMDAIGGSKGRLQFYRKQLRLIEQAEDGTCGERAALSFLDMIKTTYILKLERENLQTVFFESPYPSAVFRFDTQFGEGGPTISHSIIAPLPQDLVIPQHMPYSAWEFPKGDMDI